MHDSGFTGAKCSLVTRCADLLAEGSKLPTEVAALPILRRYAWAFEGRRVPHIVRLLAAIVEDIDKCQAQRACSG